MTAAIVLLTIEFLDELVFGAREAAWPLIRNDLGLSYLQVGLLLGVPGLVSNGIEPLLGIAGDLGRRSLIVRVGGIAMAVAIGLLAGATRFWMILVAFLLMYPASGAFVSLSQATLMDREPERRERNMARWTFAGSVGNLLGPLALALLAAIGAGWRALFWAFAALTLVLAAIGGRNGSSLRAYSGFREGLRGVARALGNRSVLRWLLLLQFADLMLDVLLGFLALYFVDVAGAGEAVAAAAVAVWTGVGLAGDALLVILLERIRGVRYLRASAAAALLAFPAFLLVPSVAGKLVLLALLGLLRAGWYAILQARLYAALPGQSGTAMAAANVAGLLGAVMVIGLGAAAERFGLAPTMWALLAAPLALLAGLPGRARDTGEQPDQGSG